MPHTRSITEIPSNEVAEHAMQKVHEFLAYLEKDEIAAMLSALREEITADIEELDAITSQQNNLLSSASRTENLTLLKEIHDQLNSLELERFLKTHSVSALHNNCTEYRDLLARHSVNLVTKELNTQGKGTPPVPFSLVSMGSDGRGEQTLITDQDYLIVYGDGGGEAADRYFSEFSATLVERLAEIGFKKCTGDIMPSNPTWRGSFTQWKRRLLSIVRYEFEDYAKNLMDLIVLSDARFVAGDAALAEDLIATIRALEKDYFQVLWGMAKAATEMRLALGFLKRLWTEGSGDHKGEFNIKLLAWAPLVMNVRILAINQGIPATNTVKRLELLEQQKSFSRSTAQGLMDAYYILTKHRILLQIKVIKGIQKESYYLNPYELSGSEREKIRQALLRIEDLQKIIHTNFSIM